MSEDREERRQKDLRDLEFYRQRLRPTVADLWRILREPGEKLPVITEPRMSRRSLTAADRVRPKVEVCNPDPGAPDATDSRKTPAGLSETDAIGPLIAALSVLLLLGLSGNIGKIPQAWLF